MKIEFLNRQPWEFKHGGVSKKTGRLTMKDHDADADDVAISRRLLSVSMEYRYSSYWCSKLATRMVDEK